MDRIETPQTLCLVWEQLESPPDWTELPERNRQEILTILASMLLNCQKKVQEGEDERQP